MTDEALVRACVEGNMAAQKKLFDKYSRVMMGLCLRYASCVEEAQDLAQDGWIKRIMVNTSLDHLRRNKQLTQSIDQSNENHSALQTDADAFSRLSAKELMAIIQQLPAGYRSVFNLYAIEGFSHKEIGTMLNIAESTSKSQYLRAKASLQKMLLIENVVS